MKQVLGIVHYNFFGYFRNPKVIFTFLLEFVLSFLLTGRIMVVMENYDTPVQAVEPFLWTFGDAQFSSVASVVLRPAKDDTSYSISVNSNNKEKMAFGTVYLYYSCDCSLYSIDAAIYICTVYEGQLSGQPVERDCCHARIF